MSRRVLRLFLAIAIVGLLAIAAGVTLAPAARWRARIVFDKATGKVEGIGWSELLQMLRPGSDIYLEQLAQTRNPYLSIQSPKRSKSDIQRGAQLFLEDCTPCHGDQGRGGAGGPNLYDRVYRQGRSDWALYNTIQRGVPKTAMVGRNLARDDIWRLVSYLQATMVESASGASDATDTPIQSVTPADLRNAPADPAEWLTYSGSYSAQRYSKLRQVDRQNVGQLRVEWQRQFSTPAEKIETTPIVRGETMFVTEPPDTVFALDAKTGQVLWAYSRELPAGIRLCCGQVNRGTAVLGDRVFVGTLDAHLLALNANTGKPEWDVAVADSSKGYSITSAPLAVDDMIVTGIGGGEYGIRGFVDAYDAASGQRRWRFYTTPEPGQPGSETWQGGAPTSGAPTWLTGSYDPELRLIYWGVGNPSLNFYGEKRKGDNLYSNSVLALDADTGKLRWYFQFTPHDLHDWDSAQIPVIVNAPMGGMERKLLAWANRNGYYYLLDRSTGKFLTGAPFVKQTWSDGLDGNGRPRTRPEAIPTRQGSLVYPSLIGATNWWPPTYDPELELFYVPCMDRGGIFYAWPDRPPNETGALLGGYDTKVPNEDLTVGIKALEVRTGKTRWQNMRHYSSAERRAQNIMGGLLSTAGRLVFGADADVFLAWDAETGDELWRFETGGMIAAAPITYEQHGRQYVAVAAGRSILAFALPSASTARRPVQAN